MHHTCSEICGMGKIDLICKSIECYLVFGHYLRMFGMKLRF